MNPITDPEVKAFIARTEACYPADSNLATAAENRRIYDAMCLRFRQPRPAGVAVGDSAVAASDPERQIAIRRYRRTEHPVAATVLYGHGGGFIVGGLESHDDICAELCKGGGCDVVSVDYRLVPEHPYPAQLDDFSAVYQALAASGRHLVVAGDSAGGALAAALCLRIRRLGWPPALGQVLVHPGLGGDYTAPSYDENAEAPLLRTRDCQFYAEVCAKGLPQEMLEDPEYAPLKAADFSGLPPAFVVTADVDPLRDDGRDYVAALQKAGGWAQWRNEPQLVHGYLRARHESRRAAASFAAIVRAVTMFAQKM